MLFKLCTNNLFANSVTISHMTKVNNCFSIFCTNTFEGTAPVGAVSCHGKSQEHFASPEGSILMEVSSKLKKPLVQIL